MYKDSNTGSRSAARDLLMIVTVWLSCFVAEVACEAVLPRLFADVMSDAMALRCMNGVRVVVLLVLPALLLNKMLAGAGDANFVPSIVRPLMPAVMLTGILATVALVPVVTSLSLLNHLLLPQSGWLHDMAASQDASVNAYYAIVMPSLSPADWVVNIAVVAILAGVGEELFFRGILQGFALRCGMRGWVAVLVVALFFSLVHFQVSEFVPRLAMGLVLGYAYLLSGHIWLPVVMHIANNVVALLTYNYPLAFGWQWLVGIVAGAGLIAIALLRKHKK